MRKLAWVVLVGIAACGADDDSPGGDAGQPGFDSGGQLTVVSSVPAAGATAVAPDTPISVTFSAEPIPASVTGSTVRLLEGTATVQASLAVSGDTVTITPSASLRHDRSYTIEVTTGVSGAAGPLAGDVDIGFDTVTRAWTAAAPIDPGGGPVAEPRLGCAAGPDAMATWLVSGIAGFDLMASRYLFGSGWSSPDPLDTGIESVTSPSVAVADNGDAVALWEQIDGASGSVWSARFGAGTQSWATAIPVESSGEEIMDPRLAVAANGDAFAVWEQFDTVRWNAWRAIDEGGGWSPDVLESANPAAAGPVVAADASGNAIAVWTQSATPSNLWASRYVKGSGWSTPEQIATSTATRDPHLALTPSGDAVVVWQQFSNNVGSVWANRFTVSGGWGTPEPLEDQDLESTGAPRVAVDAAGNAVAVWTQQVTTPSIYKDLWANRFSVGEGSWSGAVRLESADGDVTDPDVAISSRGDAIAIFSQWSGTAQSIRANRYLSGIGWLGDEPIETDDSGNATAPRVCFGRDTNTAIAVWLQVLGGQERIISARFE